MYVIMERGYSLYKGNEKVACSVILLSQKEDGWMTSHNFVGSSKSEWKRMGTLSVLPGSISESCLSSLYQEQNDLLPIFKKIIIASNL